MNVKGVKMKDNYPRDAHLIGNPYWKEEMEAIDRAQENKPK